MGIGVGVGGGVDDVAAGVGVVLAVVLGGSGVGVGVGVGVWISSRTGRSVRCTVGFTTGGVVVGAVDGCLDVVGWYSGAVLVESLWPNGFSSTSVISASGTATRAMAFTGRVPPYLPIGPRTGRPCSSTQNAQRRGGAGQDSGGCQRLGGRQSARGGDGHCGGVLNCLTSILPQGSLSITRRE